MQPAVAQSLISCVTKWSLTQQMRSSDDFHLLARVSETQSLYILTPSTAILYIFAPANSTAVQIDLSHKVFGPNIADFIPLSNSSLLLAVAPHLLKVNLQTQVVTTFDPQAGSQLISCNIMPFVVGYPVHSLSQIGQTNSILVCSRQNSSNPARDIWGLTSIDITSSQSVSLVNVPGPAGEFRPWSSVVAGKDGKIYAYVTGAFDPFSAAVIPNFDPNIHNTGDLVLRYTPATSTWEQIIIPYSFNIEGNLVAVDSSSNMYFSNFVYGTNSHFQLVKVAPSGNVIWSLTQNDLGYPAKLLDVTSDGYLWMFKNPDTDSGMSQIQICATNNLLASPASTTIIKPTNTP